MGPSWYALRPDGVASDLRHGVRVFRKRPLLTALALLTLSLGIGANAAVFSVFDAVLLRPLPYPEADRLVLLVDRLSATAATSPTIPELLDVQASSRSLDGVTYLDTRDFQIEGGQEPERVVGARMEPSFLSLLDVRPAAGRLFSPSDGAVGNTPVVLLGNGLWHRAFGGDPGVVGRTLRVDGDPHLIVGVVPETFSFAYLSSATIDLYLPYPASTDYTTRAGEFANVRRVMGVARLARGVAIDAAQSELAVISTRIAAEHPELYPPRAGSVSSFVMTLDPLREALNRDGLPTLYLLLGAVALVLVLACVNTAQFLLAQAVDRGSELAIRSALGASRGRLVRQVLSETLLLAGAGGLLGIAQAVWFVRLLRAVLPRSTTAAGGIALDGSALAFLLAVTLASAIASGLVPALRASRQDAQAYFAGRGATDRRGRLRHALIASEVALSIVLLVPTGVLLRSLQHVNEAQGGFSTDRVALLRVRGMAAGSALGDLYSRYVEAMARIDGIETVGAASSALPGRPSTRFTIVGDAPSAAVDASQQASYQIVSGGYFSTVGIRLEAGRLFTEEDTVARAPVAIINREMARRFWPNDQPLGRQIHAGDGPREATMTIVGIVGNVRPPFQSGDVPQIYVSYRQQSEANMLLVVRTRAGRRLPLSDLKQAVWSVEPRQAVFGITALEDQVRQATLRQRSITAVIGGFAVLALMMSLSGAYTVVAFLLSQRFREMAIRLAIGATGRRMLWSLAGPTFLWTLAGLVPGAAAAVMACRALRTAIAGVMPLDLPVLGAIAIVYVGVAALALVSGARGALRIDVAGTLRGA